MQLDRIVIEPRARSAWEAIDLGFLLARAWWRELFLAWLVPSAVLLCVLFIVIPSSWWWINPMIIWWLKPIWDCAPLYIASQRLFGENIRLRDAWRTIPRTLGSETIAWLTWRRFNVSRSVDMPVTLLENLRGNERRKRLSILHRNIGSSATWLTITCGNAEMILYFGTLVFLFWMVPESFQFNPFLLLNKQTAPVQLISGLFTFFTSALIAPFYTMAGFALYISRRIELEGWDIEIRFRHIATKRSRQHPHNAVTATALLLIAIFCGGSSTQAQAEDTVDTQEIVSHQRIARIIDSSDFNTQTETWHWRLKNKSEEATTQSAVPEWLIRCVEWLEKLSGKRNYFVDAAQVIRFILAVTLISLAIYLLYRYRDITRRWLHLPTKKTRHTTPDILFGLDVRTENLPDDVPAEVLQLWRSEQPRTALSLLYRATLAQLLTRFSLPFHSDHTELECAAIVENTAPPHLAPFFHELTATWQRLAYAHQLPRSEVIEHLCMQWREAFADAH
ncbi:MAG: DUF4129 domain-containing protein [Spongiibacteraceae bacterium]